MLGQDSTCQKAPLSSMSPTMMLWNAITASAIWSYALRHTCGEAGQGSGFRDKADLQCWVLQVTS